MHVNVVQHLRYFGRFEMNKRDRGRQREDRILVAEEEILHEIENQPGISTRRLANHLGVSQLAS
jgi:AcrR family transcriptional regulator